MSENYTAEDFARVNRAKRGAIEVASRVDPESGLQWRFIASNGITGWLTDEGMAAGGWTPVVEARPITPDDLAAAWEAAAVPTDDDPIREGDTLIFRGQQGDFAVFEQAGLFLKRHIDGARVLSRAPQREPWQDLEDVLRNEIDLESDPGGIAHALHLKGWRKGGDES